MKIGKFSKMTGLSVLTIRYYIDLGLFTPQRSERYWDFSEEDLSRAAEIARYKSCGFSLQTIAELFSLLQGSTLSKQERMRRLHSVLDCESQRIQTNRRQLTLSLDKLNSMIRDIQGQVVTDSFNGIPLYLFSQICCSFCGKPLQWKDVCIANHQVFHGVGSCSCGFCASVTEGILVVENIQTPLIPAVDRNLYTLQHRTPQDVSYIESFNQWLNLQLNQLDLEGKIVFEDVLNTACFLNRAISDLNVKAYYILCDTDLQVVRYYMSSIRSAYPEGNFLFMVDDGIHHPLKEGCLDVIIDYAASEIYQKYGYRSSSTPLRRFAHDGTILAGRFSRRCKKQFGKRNPLEDATDRYQLPALLQDMQNNGVVILKERVGNRSVDSSVYAGALPGDVFKPYAFIGRWSMK